MKSFRKEQPPKDVKVLVRYMTYTGAVYDEMKYTTGPGGVSWFENDSGKAVCKSSVTHWDYMSNQSGQPPPRLGGGSVAPGCSAS